MTIILKLHLTMAIAVYFNPPIFFTYRILRSYCTHKCQKIHLLVRYQSLLLVAASNKKLMVSDSTYLKYVLAAGVFDKFVWRCAQLCVLWLERQWLATQ